LLLLAAEIACLICAYVSVLFYVHSYLKLVIVTLWLQLQFSYDYSLVTVLIWSPLWDCETIHSKPSFKLPYAISC